MRHQIRGNAREQPALCKLEGRLSWASLVKTLERSKGETWEQFSQRHGDWSRDAALWLGRKRGRYTLRELGQLGGPSRIRSGFSRRPTPKKVKIAGRLRAEAIVTYEWIAKHLRMGDPATFPTFQLPENCFRLNMPMCATDEEHLS